MTALLSDKIVLVTAAAGTGIGFATAKRCAEEGATVVLSDRHERRLGESADLLAELIGTRPVTAVCDVTNQEQVDAMFEVWTTLQRELSELSSAGFNSCLLIQLRACPSGPYAPPYLFFGAGREQIIFGSCVVFDGLPKHCR